MFSDFIIFSEETSVWSEDFFYLVKNEVILFLPYWITDEVETSTSLLIIACFIVLILVPFQNPQVCEQLKMADGKRLLFLYSQMGISENKIQTCDCP